MRFTKEDYFGSPCIKLHVRGGVHMDLDWNTRKLGWSLWLGTNEMGEPHRRWDVSLCLDVRPPLGEPARLGLSFLNRHVTIGLSPGMGTQTWDWRRSEWTHTWRWLSIFPLDHRERWDAAHPDAAAKRAARLRATGGRWGG